jgi:hypothetical protein
LALTNNSNHVLYLPQYFKYSVSLSTLKNNSGVIYTKDFTLSNCMKENFPLIDQKSFDASNLNKTFCVENQNLTINGSWENEVMNYVSIKISICTDEPHCAPYEEIMNFIFSHQVYFSIFYQDTFINPQNATHPLTYNLFSYYKGLKLDNYKYAFLYVRNQSLISDEGFLFKSYSNSMFDSVAFDYDFFDDCLMGENNVMVEFDIAVSLNKFIYRRSYLKIQTVFGNLGGIGNIFNILLTLCVCTFSVISRDEIILNKIFDFDINVKNEYFNMSNNSNKSGKKSSIFKTGAHAYRKNNMIAEELNDFKNFIDFKDSSILKNIPSNQENINENEKNDDTTTELKLNNFISPNLEKVINQKPILKNNRYEYIKDNNINFNKISKKSTNNDDKKLGENKNFNRAKQTLFNLNFQKKRKEISFSFCEIISAYFCWCICLKIFSKSEYIKKLKLKKSLYNKSQYAISNFFDITYIINKLEEFEKLKLVILDSKQIALFNFISKELISLDESKIKNHYLSSMRGFTKNKENMTNLIIELRQRIRNSSNVNVVGNIDKKLLNLLNDEFRV